MIDFLKVELSVKELKNQVAAGAIDQQTFEGYLLEMIDYAADGYYWMFGYKSENWYRHDGEKWMRDEPGQLRYLTPSYNHKLDNSFSVGSGKSLESLWASINWVWFITSLIILGLIGWVVYVSNF